MSMSLISSLHQFIERCLQGYHKLQTLNQQLQELVEQDGWEEIEEILGRKQKQIDRINRITHEYSESLQGLFPGLRLNSEGWSQLLGSLSKAERQSVEPLLQITRETLLQIQQQEVIITERTQKSKEQMMKNIQKAKTNKVAQQAYEQYGNMPLFIDKQR